MVFKPFTHLARQLPKNFTHGYAQSVIAASQSSYASSTTSFGPFSNHTSSRYGKAGTSQHQNVFQTPNVSLINGKSSHQSSSSHTDGGLAAYYAAWQQLHEKEGEKEWKQFQFTKRIGWKPQSATRDEVVEEAESVETSLDLSNSDVPRPDRAYSASTVEEIKALEDAATVTAPESKVDKQAVEDALPPPSTVPGLYKSTSHSEFTEDSNSILTPPSSLEEIHESQPATPKSLINENTITDEATATNSKPDSPSQAYHDHIQSLAETNRYAEIPAIFEAMLIAGIKPSTLAYNALLSSAIRLPSSRHRVVPKALDVYADMFRRQVLPDTVTYSTLIDLLASRGIYLSNMKRDLDARRKRFGGMEESEKFMLQSNEAEFAILAEDDSLSMALKLFATATSARKEHTFSTNTYQLLTTACAEQRRVSDMIGVYAHMEARKIVPRGPMFPPMIQAFAATGDLSSAVECYNEYKSLAVANEYASEKISVSDRKDEDIYAAVVRAYLVCRKPDGAAKFYNKLQEAYQDADTGLGLPLLTDTVVLDGFIQELIDQNSFAKAMQWAQDSSLGDGARNEAYSRICTAAADHGDVNSASAAFDKIRTSAGVSVPAAAMLALHIRRGEVDQASSYWTVLVSQDANMTRHLVEPASMYAVALIGSGAMEQGFGLARQIFERVRSSASSASARAEASGDIDEGIEFIGRFLNEKRLTPSTGASMELLWAMIENGGMVTHVVDTILSSLNTASMLRFNDLVLVTQIQTGIIIERNGAPDAASVHRFANLLSSVLASNTTLDARTTQLIEDAIKKVCSFGSSPLHPDLLLQWQQFLHPVPAHLTISANGANSRYDDTFDPHSTSTDYKGSSTITDILEKGGSRYQANQLDEALIKFRNMRRAGRHPRYITYAKLITAAAKVNRINLAHDILAMARTDVPLIPQYRIVRYGWVSILDSMVGACLTLGNRQLAAEYHQELLDIGAAPTANTFGLYITTLKESTRTFDEATEAVKIFHRAKSEGVEPTSFLYNALIGKLGKARRIDDCLFYFAEMRSLGIRPTSVTYGTIVNALCRVSDENFAEELFEEMEAMPNYKPRPAPYNSLMQYFLTSKREKSKVLGYYDRMISKNIEPTMHTYKLLIDTHATLEPIDLSAAEAILETIIKSGQKPEAVHYASLIHARGCVLHDMDGAQQTFDSILADKNIRPQACLYQALFESMVANHRVADTDKVLKDMSRRGVEMTPYIANTLIHGWAMLKDIARSKAMYDAIGSQKREPSTYEAMARAFLAMEDRDGAKAVVQEMLARGYPSAVSGKILELVGGNGASMSTS